MAQVEPGLVTNDDVNRIQVGQRQVLQIAVVPFLVDRRNLTEVSLSPDHIQRTVKAVPFVFDLKGHHRALSLEHSKPPHLGVQPEPGFIHHPSFHPAAFSEVFQIACQPCRNSSAAAGSFLEWLGRRTNGTPPAFFNQTPHGFIGARNAPLVPQLSEQP